VSWRIACVLDSAREVARERGVLSSSSSSSSDDDDGWK